MPRSIYLLIQQITTTTSGKLSQYVVLGDYGITTFLSRTSTLHVSLTAFSIASSRRLQGQNRVAVIRIFVLGLFSPIRAEPAESRGDYALLRAPGNERFHARLGT